MTALNDRWNRVVQALRGPISTRDVASDFGWKEDLCFEDFYRAYARNGLATAAIDNTIGKVWESEPSLWETEKPGDTADEREAAKRFTRLRVWQALATVDARSMVGAYAGAILLLDDGKAWDQPVGSVGGGVDGLLGVLAAWEGELEVVDRDIDPLSRDFGQPTMYQFNENSLPGMRHRPGRQGRIHPDRVLIWSQDGSLNCRSALEPGWNDLVDAEKVKGAGGEGFWKTSRGAPIVEAAADMKPDDIIRMFGATDGQDLANKLNERADDFQSGFHKMLMLGGLTAKPMTITLPSPEHFYNVPVMSFAASMQMPVRVLIGNQTGERASTEDAEEWAKVCMGRRSKRVVPLIHEFIDRLMRFGILPRKEWVVGWPDLLDATPDQKLDRAAKMQTINKNTLPGDQPAFRPNEIREAAGYEAEQGLDEPEDEDLATVRFRAPVAENSSKETGISTK